ncbi:branched-chain amino acid ABC transporter permease [Tepidanaerobacter syntrophicus]|uniref:Branched-chain amino acid transport system permease protein n=1 Tax=Tepidanaerobacter syntrophicus TaxID=224999 RepID=A0A0U9HPT9_9FIRM|nr:branched-chain amino acid ABC transporter permease [Tepidanaerobacter syntrophicus]GAQ25905.1 branched-chain amino acid transport system permease protein [Tepidanaerobacter syntrophicus]GLI50478.1 branched-chain amino acid ABC transporter permease [Tepidanaerobacter syntrophicus]HHV82622.1 branched-chain amino acid ABC transporter permease [Tepidanaerobacter syntrophicus]
MSSYLQGIIILVGINLIAVLGISILTGFTRLFSFGNAGFMSIGAYVSAIMTAKYGIPFIPALVFSALFAGCIAYLLGTLTLKLKGDYFLITTLGFGECVRVLFAYMEPATGGARGFASIPHYTTLFITVISVILAFVFAWNLVHSKTGRNLIAVREQELAAEMVGIDTFSSKKLSFVISAIYAGWAGALYSHNLTFISPEMFNLAKSSELTITAVIGGLGSLTGTVLGTLLVTLLPEVFRSLASYRMLIYGIAVVTVIVFKPDGLYGYREFSISKVISHINNIARKVPKKGADANHE